MCSKNLNNSSDKQKYHNYVVNSESENSDDTSDGLLHNITVIRNGGTDDPYYCEVNVDKINIIFELDTGSRISAISKVFYDKYFDIIFTKLIK